MNKLKVLIAAPESDCHVVAIKLLEIYMIGNGIDVVNLGVNTPVDELIRAIADHRPAAVLISSQNGHAYSDLKSLSSNMKAHSFNMPVFIGGTLGINSSD